MSRFGSNLKKVRERAGLHQKELASLAGMTQATISNWETGQRPLPEPDAIRRLAAVPQLKTTTVELMKGVVTEYDALRGSDEVSSEDDGDELSLTPNERELIRDLRTVPADHAQFAMAWLRGTLKTLRHSPELMRSGTPPAPDEGPQSPPTVDPPAKRAHRARTRRR